uniref:Uncharacterized protein n=1 Tax=Leersia perrieri TaxID=77586 RepID=A0A0D9V4Y3_9ORYZ
MRLSVTLGTALVDIVFHVWRCCGSHEVFDSLAWAKGTFTLKPWPCNEWHGRMGRDRDCLELFKRIESTRVERNGVNFVAVLRGCFMAQWLGW